MKVILEGTDNEAFDAATDLRVLVAYQNAAFALRAKAMLKRVAQDATRQGRLWYSMWDFNNLGEPVLLPIATEEALAANIIVFSAQEGKVLPKAVRNWTTRWLLAKESLPQALVASLHHEPAAGPTQAVVRPYLAGVAKYGKMHFFAGGSDGRVPVDLSKVDGEFRSKSPTPRQKLNARPTEAGKETRTPDRGSSRNQKVRTNHEPVN